jgi:hypothetical protein
LARAKRSRSVKIVGTLFELASGRGGDVFNAGLSKSSTSLKSSGAS